MTYRENLLERFMNGEDLGFHLTKSRILRPDGYLCPYKYGYLYIGCSKQNCKQCWDTEMTESDMKRFDKYMFHSIDVADDEFEKIIGV